MALRQVSFADIALQYVDLMDAKEYPTKSPELAHRRSLIRSNTVADGGDNGEAAQAAEATAQQQQQALAVAQRLLRMAETIDKKTSNSIKQKLEEEFKNVTVFQLSYEAFKNACRQTLTSLQGSINGWQQYFLINHGFRVVSSELRRVGEPVERIRAMSQYVATLDNINTSSASGVEIPPEGTPV